MPARITLIKAAALAGALALTCIVVLVISHDPNAAIMSFIDKHERLATLPSPKIVLIGDSNLTYGLASDLLEKDLGVPVVNTGYTGGLGLRFVLEDAAPDIHKDDVVVIVPAYEQFSTLLEGNGNILDVLVYRPASVRAITSSEQARRIVSAIPSLLQTDLKRFILSPILHRLIGKETNLGTLYRRNEFNTQGDLTGYLQEQPHTITVQKPLPTDAITPAAIDALNAFNDRMRAIGAKVVLIYPPFGHDAYEMNRTAIASIDRGLRERTRILIPASPERYVFPQEALFDGPYHVFGQARLDRTRLMTEDLDKIIDTPSP